MKIEFLVDTPGHEVDDPSKLLVRKAGDTHEHPDAWRLCLPNGLGKILAKPADEECQTAVDDWKVRNKKK